MKAWSIFFLTLALEPTLSSCLPVIPKSEGKGTSPISRSRSAPDDEALEYVTIAIPKTKNRPTEVYVEDDDAVEDEHLDITSTSAAAHLDIDADTDADADSDAEITVDTTILKASSKIKPASIIPPLPPPEHLVGKVQKPFKSPENPFLGGDDPTTPHLDKLKGSSRPKSKTSTRLSSSSHEESPDLPLSPPAHLKISPLTPLPPIRTAATSIPPSRSLSLSSRPFQASSPSTSLKPINPPKPHPKPPAGSYTIHSHAAELKRRSTENFNAANPAYAPNAAPRAVKGPKTRQLGVLRNMQVQSHGFPELKKRGLDGHPEDVERERRRRGGVVPIGRRGEEGLVGLQYKMRRRGPGEKSEVKGVEEEKREVKGNSRIMKRDMPAKKRASAPTRKIRRKSQAPQGYNKNPNAAWRKRDL